MTYNYIFLLVNAYFSFIFLLLPQKSYACKCMRRMETICKYINSTLDESIL